MKILLHYEIKKSFRDHAHLMNRMKATILLLVIGTGSIFAGNVFYQDAGHSLNLTDMTLRQATAEIETNSAVPDQSGKWITGTVVDENNEPVPGATVTIQGTTRGVITDMDGKFTIEVKSADILDIKYLGYQTSTITVGEQKELRIQLQVRPNELDEVTVVAFGKQKKSSVVASISTVKPSDLKVPSSNLTTAMAGRIAGVISYQRSGEPGADNAEFFIRGVTTFGYKKDPLILIDNIESSTTDLARLQTDDIESFSIMKDATATALYGSRAANGVILIKTKEGREGAAIISVRIENTMSRPTSNLELADPITYMKLNQEAILTRNPLGVLPYTQEKIDRTMDPNRNPYVYPAVDWRRELIKNYTMNQGVNLNVRGGGNVARYYVAGSFNQDNGLLKVDKRNNFNNNINLKTFSLRTNVNINITRTTELNVRLSGRFDDYIGPIKSGKETYESIMHANPVLFPPYYPIDNEHSYITHIMFGNYDNASGGGASYINPYAEMVRGYKEYSQSVMSAQFEAVQKLDFITKGLNLRAMVNTTRDAYFNMNRQYTPFWYMAAGYDKITDTYKLVNLNPEGGREYLDYTAGSRNINSSVYLETALNYDRIFNEKHAVGGVLVLMAQNRLTVNSTINTLQESLPYRNVGLAGRVTYAFDDRYLLEANFGYNASERFHKSHRWGFFPSIGVGWVISNEKFWEPLVNTVNNLKIKVTHGLSGNDDLGTSRFVYLGEVNMNNSSYGASFGSLQNAYSRPGMSIVSYADPNITWETSAKSNLAFDIGLFKSFGIELEFYREKRTNILQTRSNVPLEMGLAATPQSNIGEAEGKGIDLSVDYNKSFNKDLWLQLRANYTFAKSKYLVYEEYEYKDAPWKSHVGYSISQQWGLLAESLFVDDAEAANSPQQNYGAYGGGDIKYRDVNGDGQISILDQVPIGYPTTPEIVYGFGFSLGYKAFDLSAFFQGLARESFWIDANTTAPFIGNTQLLKAYADSHWSEENQDIYALWPRLSAESSLGHNNNIQRSTWFMQNGAFLRVKQIELGYSVPENILSRIRFSSTRIYLNTSNPFVWSKFKLWDVEMGGAGMGYPIQKVFNLGLQVSF
jgi:TonB-linked SusC/RagA family outer membrane protein